jgi:hypothetical protein
MGLPQGQRLGAVVPIQQQPGVPFMTSFYFPHDRDYHGGTDADHVPVIPGNDFPSDAKHKNESPFQYPVPGDADMAP